MPTKTKSAFPEPAARLPGEADILANVVANLADDTAKLVYADWLQDRDDPRGPLLRNCVAAFRAGKPLPALKAAPKPWRDVIGISLFAAIRKAKLTDRTETLLRLAKPALTFKSAKTSEANLDVGASKLGGRADLPSETKWPTYHKEPLAFLGQFNLADLSASFVCRELPNSGVFSVFYFPDEEDERESDPKGTFRVFHFPNVSKLARREPPEELAATGRYKSCRLTFTETLTLPDPESPWRKELTFKDDDEAEDHYQETVLDALGGLGHRILGYAPSLQNDVHRRKEMRHLLTIDSDDNPDWMWGDGGLLYFTINEEYLKAGQFDRVRCEMQCC